MDQATAALLVDIEQRKQTEALLRDRESELRHLAFHDPLTGLANRAMFHERAGQAIIRHQDSNATLAVLFVDLDNFKQVNDVLGHGAGDTVLSEVAQRLRNSVRGGDIIARLGGDEFGVLAQGVSDAQQAVLIADRIIQALAAPIDIEGTPTTVTGSVGIALHQPGQASVDDLLRRADDAMYAAKAAGKGQYVLAADCQVDVGAG